MKVNFTLDRNAASGRKSDVVARVNRELGSKVTISGDVITVDSYDERRVVEILNHENLKYSRST